jgi:hypothetical protein
MSKSSHRLELGENLLALLLYRCVCGVVAVAVVAVAGVLVITVVGLVAGALGTVKFLLRRV